MKDTLKNFIDGITVEELEKEVATTTTNEEENSAEQKYALAREALTGVLPEQIVWDNTSLGLALLSALPADKRAELTSLSTLVVKPVMIREAIKREPLGKFVEAAIEEETSTVNLLALLCSVIALTDTDMKKEDVLWTAFIAIIGAGMGHGSETIIDTLVEAMDDTTLSLLIVRAATAMEGE